LIIGEKEMEAKNISVRRQGEGDQGQGDQGAMSISEFADHIKTLL